MERKNLLAIALLVALAAVGVLMFLGGGNDTAEAAEGNATQTEFEVDENGEPALDEDGTPIPVEEEPSGSSVFFAVSAAESAGEEACLDLIEHTIEFVLRDVDGRAVGLAEIGDLNEEDCSLTQQVLIERIGESQVQTSSNTFGEAEAIENLVPSRVEVRYDTIPVASLPITPMLGDDDIIIGWDVVNSLVITPVDIPARFDWDDPLQQLETEDNSSGFGVEPFEDIENPDIVQLPEGRPELEEDPETDGFVESTNTEEPSPVDDLDLVKPPLETDDDGTTES